MTEARRQAVMEARSQEVTEARASRLWEGKEGKAVHQGKGRLEEGEDEEGDAHTAAGPAGRSIGCRSRQRTC